MKNYLPHSTLSFKTLYQVLNGELPSLDHLKSFGTPCITHIMPEERSPGSKLHPRGKEGILCGYTDSTKLYHIYFKETQQVKISHDVTFSSTSVGREIVNLPEILEELPLNTLEEQKLERIPEKIPLEPPSTTKNPVEREATQLQDSETEET